MTLSAPIKYFKLDVEDEINIQRLRMIQGSSFVVNITLYQGDTIIDLTDADDISLVYSDNSTFEETITGASSAPTTGVCTFNFTPSNTNHYGVFVFFIKVAETGGNTIIFPYGQLILMES
jgi:hypothetical protein